MINTLVSSGPPRTSIIPHGVIPPVRPLMTSRAPPNTPWHRVIRKFRMSTYQLGIALGRDQSVIVRAINRYDGLILPWYQVQLLKLAKRRGIIITPDDLFPRMDDV